MSLAISNTLLWYQSRSAIIWLKIFLFAFANILLSVTYIQDHFLTYFYKIWYFLNYLATSVYNSLCMPLKLTSHIWKCLPISDRIKPSVFLWYYLMISDILLTASHTFRHHLMLSENFGYFLATLWIWWFYLTMSDTTLKGLCHENLSWYIWREKGSRTQCN